MALIFDGIVDYVYLNAYADAYTFPNNTFTISFWFKPKTLADISDQSPINFGSVQVANSNYLCYSNLNFNRPVNTKLYFGSTSQTGFSSFIYSPDPVINKWNHSVFSFTNTTMTCRTNGVKVTKTTDINVVLPTLNTLVIDIGIAVGGRFSPYWGEIAEVGMWNGIELNDNEALSLWRGSPPSNIRADKLVMSLPMETVNLTETPNIPPILSKTQGQNVGTLKSNGHPPVVVGIPEM